MSEFPLRGRVALVAGATRGAGRGIAVELGAAGALVYVSGRSSRAERRKPGHRPFELAKRPETIEETAELVTAAGGQGIAVVADHGDQHAVRALAERIGREQGRLDVLVNDIWGGEELTEWGTPIAELDLAKGFQLLERAVNTHIVTSRFMIPLLRGTGAGLIVEVTDGDAFYYRSNLFYDLAKTSVIRLAFCYAEELAKDGITAVAVTPGFLRSEAMLDHFGVTSETWRKAAEQDPNFLESETPRYVGRGIVALAADPELKEKSGGLFSSWGLAREYGFTDVDGRRPDWGMNAAAQSFGAEQRASHQRFVTMGPRTE